MFNEEGGKHWKGPVVTTPLDESESITNDPSRVLKLCTDFSSAVLESIILLFADESLLEDAIFVENIRALIQVCTQFPFLETPSLIFFHVLFLSGFYVAWYLI